MIILWVNIQVWSPPSWKSVFRTTSLQFSSWPQFWTRARNPVGPRPVDRFIACAKFNLFFNSYSPCQPTTSSTVKQLQNWFTCQWHWLVNPTLQPRAYLSVYIIETSPNHQITKRKKWRRMKIYQLSENMYTWPCWRKCNHTTTQCNHTSPNHNQHTQQPIRPASIHPRSTSVQFAFDHAVHPWPDDTWQPLAHWHSEWPTKPGDISN